VKLVILSQYYPPETGAPQRRLSDLARRMVAAGHDVTVLTAIPNYPRGRVYEGYGGMLSRETIDGVRVIRTWIFPTLRMSIVLRLFSYLSFVISAAVFGTCLLGRADYLLVESPPLFLGLTGAWLARTTGARMIFNVSDLLPEGAVRLGLIRRGDLSFRLSAWLERFSYNAAWLVTGQSRTIVSDVQARFPETRTYWLSNGADVRAFRPDLRSETARATLGAHSGRKFICLYAGLHGAAQGLGQVLDAAALLGDDPDLGVVLIGDGPERQALVQRARAERLAAVTFVDAAPAGEMPALVASADVVLVTLKQFFPGAVPSKLYEAMASGTAIVLAADGEAADIVRRHDAGLTVAPGDVDGLADAIQILKNDPERRRRLGQNGRRAAESDFTRERIAAQFIQHLEDELHPAPAAAAVGQTGATGL
jgi:glycosyltransferase involved in cell wall biosynthesis